MVQLKKLIFGSQRERFIAEVNSNQLSLFGAESDASVTVEETKKHIEYDRKAAKKHPGRAALVAESEQNADLEARLTVFEKLLDMQ